MFLWGTYQIINVVILMNLLVALMNSTIAAIQEDNITEWRFARTQIWRKYFDHSKISHLPVPFNVAEIIMNLVLIGMTKFLVKKKNEHEKDSEVDEETKKAEEDKMKEKYLVLVSQLCARYIHMKEVRKEGGK